MQGLSIDTRTLNATAQEAVHAMFWGAVAFAVVVPIASAAGGWVAGKIDKSTKKEYAIKH